MAFSTRLENASDSLDASISALTLRLLSNTTSTLAFSAIGRRRFRIVSINSFTSVTAMFSSWVFRSIFTRVSKSEIMEFSLSISSAISCINSRYNSFGTSSCVRRESASTFMEVSGVFSSWDTLDTNSCLDSSTSLSFASIRLNVSEIFSVSVQSWISRSPSSDPSTSPPIDRFICCSGRTSQLARMIESASAQMITTTIHICTEAVSPSICTWITSVEALARITPITVLVSLFSTMIGTVISIKRPLT